MLNNEFPPLGGGTGVVNKHLLDEFAGYDYLHVDLVTSSRSAGSQLETEVFAPRITIYKVPVNNRNIHHSTNRELITYFCRALALSLRLTRKFKYDVSFAFAGVPAGAISYILKVIAKLPYWISLQGPDVPGFEARYSSLYPFLKPIIRLIWAKAAIVTAISQDHRRLAHETMPNLEIPIIYNGVDVTVFRPGERLEPSSPINVLCVGRLIERKGQHHLLNAFAELVSRDKSQVKLTLVGTGDAESTLRKLTLQLGIQANVEFKGFVTVEGMPEVYRNADIFVLPSANEGMSIALLEAMASGLPVIVTDVGGTSELVQHRLNGFVVRWGDINALTEALEALVESAVLRSQMSQINLTRAMKFNWHSISQQYINAFSKIATLNCAQLSA
jgi:phosphatidylinositol alpha-1,6-mannosyltransferase